MGDAGGGNATLDAYNGNQTIASGVVVSFVGGTTFVGTNNLTISGSTTIISNFNTKVLNVTANRLTLGGPVAFSTFAFQKGSNGTLVLNGTNTGTGSTTVMSGANVVLQIQNGGGTVELGNANALSNGSIEFFLTSGAAQLPTITAGTDLTGANKVVGGLVLNNGANTAVIGGTNALEFGGTLLSGSGNNTLTINNTANTTFSGNVFLQESGTNVGRTLTVSGSGAATISGAISNGGTGGNSALTYTGSSTLTLTGTSTYTGPTTVNSGKLVLGVNGVGSLTSAVTVNAGTLGGSGLTSGIVTIGNGTLTGGNRDSFIAPGNSAGTFTTSSALSLASDAVYQFELNSTNGTADKIVANGVSLNSSALFSFTDLGNGSGVTNGQSFVIIDNTSANPISGGTFSNLADGASFVSNGVTYTANYTGGTGGNDLVLTAAVPEPGTWAMMLAGAGMLVSFRRFRRR
jgi:autotransporter-associated beta strand protein